MLGNKAIFASTQLRTVRSLRFGPKSNCYGKATAKLVSLVECYMTFKVPLDLLLTDSSFL